MSYNRFRWWESGLKKPKRLPKKSPLLSRIRNGDFSYPYEYVSALKQVDDTIFHITEKVTKSYLGWDPEALEEKVREATRIQKVRKRKLEEDFMQKENNLLLELKVELEKLFGINLWDDISNGKFQGETIEDLYNYYGRHI